MPTGDVKNSLVSGPGACPQGQESLAQRSFPLAILLLRLFPVSLVPAAAARSTTATTGGQEPPEARGADTARAGPSPPRAAPPATALPSPTRHRGGFPRSPGPAQQPAPLLREGSDTPPSPWPGRPRVPGPGGGARARGSRPSLSRCAHWLLLPGLPRLCLPARLWSLLPPAWLRPRPASRRHHVSVPAGRAAPRGCLPRSQQ